MLTFEEVKEQLKDFDELDIIEILGITSEDIVNRFEDFIEDNLEHLSDELTYTDEDDKYEVDFDDIDEPIEDDE